MFKRKKTICIFCGSQFGDFEDLAKDINQLAYDLSVNGYRILFGGGQKGLMGEVYRGASRAPLHHIIGIPLFSFLDEVKSIKKFTKLITTKTLGRRKDAFTKHGTIFVILPGAVGTMDEFFHVSVLNAYEKDKRPLIIVNIDHYWDHMEKLIMTPVQHGFMKKDALKHTYSVTNMKDLKACIAHPDPEKSLMAKYEKLSARKK